MMKHEFDELVRMTTSPECYGRIEYVYMNSDRFPDKASIAAYYREHGMDGIEAIYKDLKTDDIEATYINSKKDERIKELEGMIAAVPPIGTRMPQEDYIELEKSTFRSILANEEAILLINSSCGFEASKIEILHEGEIDDTESGSRSIKIKKVLRAPIYNATDWNYIRFNVHCSGGEWYYEFINGELYQVLL
jgi:hypothetical protein